MRFMMRFQMRLHAFKDALSRACVRACVRFQMCAPSTEGRRRIELNERAALLLADYLADRLI